MEGARMAAEICSLCAWRADCAKKFSLSGRDAHCPDFTEDVLAKQKQQESIYEEPPKNTED
jgi:hypothetical protein